MLILRLETLKDNVVYQAFEMNSNSSSVTKKIGKFNVFFFSWYA